MRWLDPMRYVLAPNGDLEGGAADWKLTGGAKVVTATRPSTSAAGDSKSLYLPSGSSATTRPMCVQLLHPTVRYFAKNRGTPVLSSLLVEALVENPLTGKVLTLPAGVHTGGTAGIRRSRHSCSPTSSPSSARTASWRSRSASSPSGSAQSGRSTTSSRSVQEPLAGNRVDGSRAVFAGLELPPRARMRSAAPERRAPSLPRRARRAWRSRERREVELGAVDVQRDALVAAERAAARASCESARAAGSGSTGPARRGRHLHPALLQPLRGLVGELERVPLDQVGSYLPASMLATSRSWSTSSSICAEAAPIISR